MKKITFFLMLLLTGCVPVCLMSQPPQYLYIQSGCQATLPDYTQKVNASDNCSLSSIVQTPAPGYLLTATNQSVTVKITAMDSFKNSSSISFLVTLLDTISPVIDFSELSADIEPIYQMYDRADSALLKYNTWYNNQFPWDSLEIVRNDTIVINYTLISK